jgi:hypothetical protein
LAATLSQLAGLLILFFSNISSHKIDVRIYAYEGELFDDFILSVEEEVVRRRDARSGSGNGPLGISIYQAADSIITIFNDTLLIHYDIGRLDGNPMRIDNYQLVEGETEPYVYLFEFTNEDYERALERGRIVK